MINFELAQYCANIGGGVRVEDLIYGNYSRFLESGLRVLTICNDGSGRSETVASYLNNIGVPALRLIGGLTSVQEKNPESLPFVYTAINNCPVAAVILTLDERRLFGSLAYNLRALYYQSSSAAIESIQRMELES